MHSPVHGATITHGIRSRQTPLRSTRPRLAGAHFDRTPDCRYTHRNYRPTGRFSGASAIQHPPDDIDTEPGRKAATRRRLLAAATDVVSRQGYHHASVDDIVRASGTSKGAFYFHFPSKESMFLALVDELTSRLVGRVDAAIADERGFERRVASALGAVFDTVAAHRGIAKILLVDVVAVGGPLGRRLLDIRGTLVGLLERYLRLAVESGAIPPQDTGVAALAWFGAIDEVLATWLRTPDPATLDRSRVALHLLLMRSVGRTARPAASDPNSPGEVERSV